MKLTYKITYDELVKWYLDFEKRKSKSRKVITKINLNSFNNKKGGKDYGCAGRMPSVPQKASR